jgi:hypothetical protein
MFQTTGLFEVYPVFKQNTYDPDDNWSFLIIAGHSRSIHMDPHGLNDIWGV